MRFGSFTLSENFISRFKDQQPQWGPLGYVTYKRTYARRLDNGETEEFWQTLERVVEGCYSVQREHCRNLGLPWNGHKAQKSAQRMFELMWEMKFLPPGRGLWMMGTSFVEEHGSAALNNCAFVSTRDLKTSFSAPFVFLMDMSMLGVGVGGDTLGANTVMIKEPRENDEDIHVVEDSREGWYQITARVLDAYVGKGTLPKKIDTSQIRPAGALINGFGGVAAGAGPLVELISNIHKTLAPLIGTPITSTAIVDLFNFIGKCVVSGNVRRSAEIMLGAPTDESFLKLKDPNTNAAELKDRRWASNNSVIVSPDTNFTDLATLTATNGEPGYYWLQNAREFGRMCEPPNFKDMRVAGCNPCSEQSLEDHELCNLVENFIPRCTSLEEFTEVLKYSYLYAKTVTLIPTHNEKTNAVMLRNRRIGSSLSGITRAKKKLGTAKLVEWMNTGYQRIRELDKTYSEWLCVPESVKVTSVKPSGTVSLLPGEPPGIHYPHSNYYFRIIRISSNSPLIRPLRKAGYRIESDVYTPNTYCVYFPVKEQNFDRSKADVSMWEQVELVSLLQAYWADNMVSATITFTSSEARDIKNVLEMFSHRLKSISFLPLTDHNYKQPPYTAIDQAVYEKAISNLKPLVLNNTVHEITDAYCEGDKCVLPTAQLN